MDRVVFRSWCPRCTKGRAEGHTKKAQKEGKTPTIGVDYAHMHSEQEKEEEKGVPIVVAKDNKDEDDRGEGGA